VIWRPSAPLRPVLNGTSQGLPVAPRAGGPTFWGIAIKALMRWRYANLINGCGHNTKTLQRHTSALPNKLIVIACLIWPTTTPQAEWHWKLSNSFGPLWPLHHPNFALWAGLTQNAPSAARVAAGDFGFLTFSQDVAHIKHTSSAPRYRLSRLRTAMVSASALSPFTIKTSWRPRRIHPRSGVSYLDNTHRRIACVGS